MLIDATLKHPMPPVALPARDYMERARELWERLGLPRAHPAGAVARLFARSWDAAWDIYARRAVSGEWDKSGEETFAARRGGSDSGDAGARRGGSIARHGVTTGDR